MILPVANVQCMDVESGSIYGGPIQNLYRKFSHKAQGNSRTPRVSEVLFSSNQLKISDWYGWTDVLLIRKIQKRVTFCGVIINRFSDKALFQLPEHCLIPVYDKSKFSKGFHGEIKYPFVVKRLIDICVGHESQDYIRHKNGIIEDGQEPFYNIICLKYESLRLIDECYQVITRSGTFNANNLYLWGREEIPEDYCKVCPNDGTHQCAGCRKENR